MKCKYYHEMTWVEPPAEPGENGTKHTEHCCEKRRRFVEWGVTCDGDPELCNLVNNEARKE